jgi:hypothetical protein
VRQHCQQFFWWWARPSLSSGPSESVRAFSTQNTVILRVLL